MSIVELKAENFVHENRLSSWNAIGTNVENSVLRTLFLETCPHQVTLIRTNNFGFDFQLKQWLYKHCEGYWTDSILLRQPAESAWYFQLESDAALFKLTWSS